MNFKDIQRALVIAAHYDDETISCGGIIRKLSNVGKEVTVIIVTDGKTGVDHSQKYNGDNIELVRKKEFMKAAEVLGISKVMFLHEKCQEVTYSKRILHKLIGIIRETRPCAIFTHDCDDKHIDHKNVNLIVEQAVWKSSENILPNLGKVHTPKILLAFECVDVIKSPAVFVDITEEYSAKIEALSCYNSQMNIVSGIKSFVDGISRVRGYQAGVHRAEAFKIISSIPVVIDF